MNMLCCLYCWLRYNTHAACRNCDVIARCQSNKMILTLSGKTIYTEKESNDVSVKTLICQTVVY